MKMETSEGCCPVCWLSTNSLLLTLLMTVEPIVLLIDVWYLYADFTKNSMLNKNISHSDSSGSFDLCFDGSVMPGDVDIMWKSVCQVSVSQLVLVCYEPQFIPQIYSPCGSKCIERHREHTLHSFSQWSNCTTSTVVGHLFHSLVRRIV